MRSMASRRIATGTLPSSSFEARKSSHLRMMAPSNRRKPMASIHKDIFIDAHPDDVWDAVRDFGAVHTRLAPGFVADARLDGDARIVTFANGMIAREVLVDCDDTRRRLVYGIANERVTH